MLPQRKVNEGLGRLKGGSCERWFASYEASEPRGLAESRYHGEPSVRRPSAGFHADDVELLIDGHRGRHSIRLEDVRLMGGVPVSVGLDPDDGCVGDLGLSPRTDLCRRVRREEVSSLR
jgi:hypothetical protein